MEVLALPQEEHYPMDARATTSWGSIIISNSDMAMMHEDLRNQEEVIQGLMNAVNSIAAASQNANSGNNQLQTQLALDQRDEKLRRAQNLLKAAQRAYHHFKVELRSLDCEKEEQLTNEKASQLHGQLLSSLKEQIQQAQRDPAMNTSNSGLFLPLSPLTDRNRSQQGSPLQRKPINFDAVNPESLRKAREQKNNITSIQNHALASLARSEKAVAETVEIGNEATETLQKQGQQLQRINRQLDHLDSEVKRGKNELRAFMRRMMTDKVLICCAILVIVCIFVLVALKVGDTKQSDDGIEANVSLSPSTTAPFPTGDSTSEPAWEQWQDSS